MKMGEKVFLDENVLTIIETRSSEVIDASFIILLNYAGGFFVFLSLNYFDE